jgi:hypothetical protein
MDGVRSIAVGFALVSAMVLPITAHATTSRSNQNSAPQSVASSTWSISLHASSTHLRIGQVLTLHVTAPAAAFRSGHRVYLEDLSTHQIMRVCSTSVGLNARSCIAQDQHESPSRQQFQAYIARTAALRVLARSHIVTVVWRSAGAWSVHLTADGKKEVTVPQDSAVTLRARSGRALGGEYSLEIRARGCIPGSSTCIRGGILITTCYSGNVCSATVTSPAEGGTKEQYRASILGPKPGGLGTVTRSPWVTVHW